jgi:hypothetical protein
LLKINTIKGQHASNGDTTKKENNMPNLMEMTNTDIAAQMQVMLISDQNDSVRKALICDEAMLQNAGRGLRCKVMLTSGISGDTPEFCAAVMKVVGEFDAFTEDNDPHGEHDFGSVIVEGQTIFWKIDLYDENYEFGAENPADFKTTRRVLTIMLASEY